MTAQALLNLPDHIKLPSTAINISSEKQFILHNFGKMAASFIVLAKDPFSVSPYKYYLPAGEFTEIQITCKSSMSGHIKDLIYFSYNNIKLKINVECEVFTINTYLDRNSIVFNDIYMGLKKHESVTVYNHSSHFIDFKWKLYKSFAIDKLENSKMIKNFEGIKELEKRRSNKLEKMNVIDYEGHSKICDKIFEDEIEELEINDSYLYKNGAFDIVPLVRTIYDGIIL